MKTLFEYCNKISRMPVLVGALILFVFFIAAVLPRQKAAMEPYTREVGSPGLSFFPAPDRLNAMAAAYGEAGRREYIQVLLTYDLAWPLAYSFLLLVYINRTLGYAHGRKASRLCVVALPPLALDYVENVCAVILFSAYPGRIDSLAWILACATCLKWIIMGMAGCLFAYGLLAAPALFIGRKIQGCRRIG